MQREKDWLVKKAVPAAEWMEGRQHLKILSSHGLKYPAGRILKTGSQRYL